MKLDVSQFEAGIAQGVKSAGFIGYVAKRSLAQKVIDKMDAKKEEAPKHEPHSAVQLDSANPTVKQLLADPKASEYIQNVLTNKHTA